MSVIFKSLKKLKAQAPAATPTNNRPDSDPREVHTLKSIIFSPVTLVLAALIGAGLYLGIIYAMTLFSDDPRPAKRVAGPTGPANSGGSLPTRPAPPPPALDPKAAPPPPRYIPLDPAQPAGSPPPTRSWQETLPGKAVTDTGPTGPPQTTPPGQTGMVAVAAAPGTSLPTGTPAGMPAAPGASASSPTQIPTRPSERAPQADQIKPMAVPAAQTVTVSASGVPTPAGPGLPAETSLLAGGPSGTPAPARSQAPPQTWTSQPKTWSASTRAGSGVRTSSLPQLALELQNAIGRSDQLQVPALLDRLGALRGEDDPYVLKMRAVWDIKNGRYPAATTRLNLVLARNPNDLEAGLNLAIVEIRTNRLDEARARLDRLAQTWPDNETVMDLRQKLQ